MIADHMERGLQMEPPVQSSTKVASAGFFPVLDNERGWGQLRRLRASGPECVDVDRGFRTKTKRPRGAVSFKLTGIKAAPCQRLAFIALATGLLFATGFFGVAFLAIRSSLHAWVNSPR